MQSAPSQHLMGTLRRRDSYKIHTVWRKTSEGEGAVKAGAGKAEFCLPSSPPPRPIPLHRLTTPARENNLALKAVITVKGCAVAVACIRQILLLFQCPEVFILPRFKVYHNHPSDRLRLAVGVLSKRKPVDLRWGMTRWIFFCLYSKENDFLHLPRSQKKKSNQQHFFWTPEWTTAFIFPSFSFLFHLVCRLIDLLPRWHGKHFAGIAIHNTSIIRCVMIPPAVWFIFCCGKH